MDMQRSEVECSGRAVTLRRSTTMSVTALLCALLAAGLLPLTLRRSTTMSVTVLLCALLAAGASGGPPRPTRPPPPSPAPTAAADCPALWREVSQIGTRQHRVARVPTRPTVAAHDVAEALQSGGAWACYATLVELGIMRSSLPHMQFKTAEHRRLESLCRECSRVPPSGSERTGVVAIRLHNGIGNMLYQYAYGRLLAESLGYEYAVTKLPREEWPPGQTRAPPHSDSGWETLTKHFRAAAPNSLGLDAEDTASALDGYGCGNKNDTLAVSDRPTDIRADPNRRPPYEVMAGAVYYRPRCIVSKGYWQDAPLYLRAGAPAKLRRWFGPATHDKATQELRRTLRSAVVIHIRNCSPASHHYRTMGLPYYEQALNYTRARGRGLPGNAYVVADPGCVRSSLIKELTELNVTLHHDLAVDLDGPAAVWSDFDFVAAAGTIILGQSTFGFWAAMMSDAIEIHVPHTGPEYPGLPEARYIFYNLRGASGRLVNDTVAWG